MGVRDLLTLIKVRITALVTLTAVAGYGLAPNPRGGARSSRWRSGCS